MCRVRGRDNRTGASSLTSRATWCETRVLWHAYIHICMYLCRCATTHVSPRLLLPSASELLHLVFTQLLTRTCHTSIEILICWAFLPLFVAHVSLVAQTILYFKVKPARHVYHTASLSLSAFVNPCCCQSFSLSHLLSVSRSPFFVLREPNCAFY